MPYSSIFGFLDPLKPFYGLSPDQIPDKLLPRSRGFMFRSTIQRYERRSISWLCINKLRHLSLFA
jgi:hypothetical protein